MTKMTTLRPVTSLADLSTLARQDEAYEHLAIIAARNLGGRASTFADALRVLHMNVMETDSEEGVVDEINFCR